MEAPASTYGLLSAMMCVAVTNVDPVGCKKEREIMEKILKSGTSTDKDKKYLELGIAFLQEMETLFTAMTDEERDAERRHRDETFCKIWSE